MEHNPPWHVAHRPSYPTFSGTAQADVIIIGGGLTGVVSAYLLAKAGKKVIVLEAGQLGQAATGHTTAFITRVIDTGARDLVRALGARNAGLVFSSGQAAIDEYERIIREENIECEFMRCPLIIYAHSPRQFRALKKEQQALARLDHRAELKHDDIGIRQAGYLEIPDQAKFHPMKFLVGLAAAAERAGAKFFENTKAESMERSGATWMIRTAEGSVSAADVIVATYNPFNKPGATRFKKAMYKSYVLQADIPSGAIGEFIATDVENPYHYLRVDHGSGHDQVIFGGEDHRLDIPFSEKRSFQALRAHLTQTLGRTAHPVQRQWSGHILESVDGLPFIGSVGGHQYVATAFSGNGMTYAMIAGLMFRDLVTSGHSPWQHVYDPHRHLSLIGLLIKGRDYMGALLGGGLKNTFRRSRKGIFVGFAVFAALYLGVHYLIFDRHFHFTTVQAFLGEGKEHIWHVAPLALAFVVLLIADRIRARRDARARPGRE